VRSIVSGGSCAVGDVLVKLGNVKSGFLLHWSMPTDIVLSDTVTAVFPLAVDFKRSESNRTESQAMKLHSLRRKYKSETDSYLYTAIIDSSTVNIAGFLWEMGIMENQSFPVVITERSNAIYTLIPRNAVSFMPGNVGKVYLIYEDENGICTVREKQFTIEDDNEQYIAVNSSEKIDVVLYTDKALKSGLEVNCLN